MHRAAVRTLILDRPERIDIALEIARDIAVNPKASPLALRAAPRSRPGISLAFFRQPLYIHPKMEYQ